MSSGIFRQKDHLRLAGKRVHVGGVGQPPAADVALYDFFEILFVEKNIALRHLDHARAVGITTADRSSEIRQARGNNGAQVTRSVNSHMHVERLPTREAKQSAGEKRACAKLPRPRSFMFSPSCRLGNARRTIRAPQSGTCPS